MHIYNNAYIFAYLTPAKTGSKKARKRFVYGLFLGSPSWTRTNDPAVNSRMLYRLSY
jgi:hypothetical protein